MHGHPTGESVQEIEYFYAAHSAFAYLGSARFMAIAAAAGRRISHKPIDLRRVVAEAGAVPFGRRSRPHAAYFFGREIERWSEERGAPWIGRIPTHHAKDITLPNGMLIAGIARGLNVDRLAHALLEAHWRDDADLADRSSLAAIGQRAGIDPVPLLDAALSTEVQAIYQANTERFADLFRRWRHVLWPGSSGNARAEPALTLCRTMAQTLN